MARIFNAKFFAVLFIIITANLVSGQENDGGLSLKAIPGEAIIRSGKRNLVFIDLGNGKFRPQDVIIGPEGENAMIQVIAGLEKGKKL